MKTYRFLINALFLSVLCLYADSLIFAQKTSLPVGLTENSTIEEILERLDQTSLPQARIGLEANVSAPEPDEIPTAVSRYYELAFFSEGFRLEKIDGCKIKLKNDNVKLLYYTNGYPDPSKASLNSFTNTPTNRFTGEILIPLRELKANKPSYRHTKKTEKANALGVWRTEFKFKSNNNFSSLFPAIWSRDKVKEKIEEFRENAMRIEITDSRQNEQNNLMYGDELTFTFDDKKTSENFYAALGRAITLCKEK